MADNDITIYDAHSRPVTKADTLSFAPQPKTPDGVMKTTPIDAAQIAAVANNPGRWPFDPGVPMQPVVQDGEPIQWPPAVGWNLLYDPNKKLGIPPYLLRAFSENCTSVRVIISQLISTAMGWDFGAVKEGTTRAHRKDTDAVRDGIKKWLKKPDGKRSMQRWLSIVVDDLTVIGAPSLARTVTLSGKPKGLKPIDSALVVPIVTASGDAPEPPAPAYYFTAYGLPYRQYTSDELLYEPMQEKSWTPFGVSPVEEVFAYIVLAINRGLYYSAYYDSGTVPAGIATCPKDWELEKIKQFADYFQTIMTGSVGKVHQLWWAPADTKIQAFKQHPDWQYDFDEFIFRLMAMRIGVDASPMVKQGGLGRPNEGLSEEALAAGIVPLKKYVATLLDTYIQDEGIGLTRVDPKTGKPRTFTRGLGQPDYHVEIIETREENKQQKLEEDTQLFDRGGRTVNSIRESRGEDPFDEKLYPLANEPLIKVSSGYVPLRLLVEMGGAAPPSPPPGQGNDPAQVAKPDQKPKAGDPEEAEPKTPIPPEAKKADAVPIYLVPEDRLPAIKTDLAKWRRKWENSGRGCCKFESEAIPASLQESVAKAMSAGDPSPFRFVVKAAPKFANLKTDLGAKEAEARGLHVMSKAYARMADAVKEDLLSKAKKKLGGV